MTRRLKKQLLLQGLFTLLAWNLLAAGRPNILVILVDDMGWSDISPYGGEIRTPTIESLAANGLRFRHFHNEARCSPTRIALLTGQHMQAAAVDPNESLPNLRTDNNVTIPELLGASGYRTYKSGKWHLGPLANGRDPISRGFQHSFGQGVNADGPGGDYWADTAVYGFVSSNGEIAATNYPPGTFYKTDADTDYALKYLDHHFSKKDGAPFFIYLAYNAPHFPLQAPAEYINKYTDVGDPNPGDIDIYRYEDGWDLTRQRRFQRQLTQGVLGPNYRLSAKHYENVSKLDIADWTTLGADRRNDLARRMAVFAAMVHKVDENIARLLNRLRAEGALDNTLIFFFSDNGGNSEGGLHGRTDDQNNAPPLTGAALQTMGLSGGASLHLGGGWANVNNTPLRFFKHHTHEGGCRTPLIVHWPNGVPRDLAGQWTDQRGHAIDIMATVLDVAGVAYPSTFRGRTIRPIAGTSLLPALRGGVLPERDLFIEHEQNRAMFRGKWKLVTKSFTRDDLPAHTVELYNMETDPMEMNNLGSYNTALLSSMIQSWNAWTATLPGLDPNRRLPSIAIDSSRFAMPTGKELLCDTFGRPNDTNIDAAPEGISGVLAGVNLAPVDTTWYEGFGGDRTQIVNGRLRMAVTSAGMSESGLMHNFVTPEIIQAGGFSIEITVTALNTVTTQPLDRYSGFGVGLTRAEAAAGNDIANPGSFRGRSDLTNGLADFFVELDLLGNVKVWEKGRLLDTVPAGRSTGTLLASFRLLSGFTAGDAVEVNVFLDGELLDINRADPTRTSRTFTWEHSQANHVGLSVRATSFGELDNLVIRPWPLQQALLAQFAVDSGWSGSDTEASADPDGDGIDTFAEWLWGTNPALRDASVASIRLLPDAGANGFMLGQRQLRNADLLGISYPVEYTTNPGQWTEVSLAPHSSTPVPESPQHEWIWRGVPRSLTDPASILFFRTRATIGPNP